MDEKSALIEVQSRIRSAKNELVIAVLALDGHKGFVNTVASLKETIGDLKTSEARIDMALELKEI